MSKKKTIEDAVLLGLIGDYFRDVCKGNARLIKLPKIADYIASHGYPSYKVTSLRRNEEARKYIDALLEKESALQEAIVYKALDVDDFLNSNRTVKAQRAALSSLDNYYHTIADTANALSQKYKYLEKKCKKLSEELDEARAKADKQTQTARARNIKIKELEAENKMLSEAVNEYVYPNIANELLKRDGDLVVDDTGINTEHLLENLITPVTNIEETPEFSSGSNVIRGLFQSLENSV